MSTGDILSYLVIGSYLFGASSWLFLFKEIKGVKAELISLRLQIAKDQGLEEGRDHETRITRLERLERTSHE